MHIYFEDCRKPEVVAMVELHRWSFVFNGNICVVYASECKREEGYYYFYVQGLIVSMFPEQLLVSLSCEEVIQ